MRGYILIVAALLAFVPGLLAQSTNVSTISSLMDTNRPVRRLSLEEAVRLAVENNFAISIARYDPQISQFQLSGVYAGYEPSLNFDVRHEYNETEPTLAFPGSSIFLPGRQTRRDAGDLRLSGLTPWGMTYDLTGGSTHTISSGRNETEVYTSDAGIALSQPLLRNFWIDQTRLSIKLARHDLRISEHRLLLTTMQVINQVQQAYYNLVAARDNVNSQLVALELAQRLVDENRQRVRVGTMAPLEERQAESEAALRVADLLAIQFTVIQAENTLKDLISNNYEQWHGVAIEPAEKLVAVPQIIDIQDSWNKGLSLRPDLNELKVQLERQGLIVRYDFNQLFPSLNLVGGYGRAGYDQAVFGTNIPPRKLIDASFSSTLHDLREETAPNYFYGATLNIPLTMRAERNRWKADKAVLEQRKLQLQELHQQILNNVDTAVRSAQSAYQRVQATRAAREFAQQALEAEQKKYENGKSRPFEVLRFQRDLIDARTAETRALADYNRSLSELAFQEGSILDRNRISVQFR